MVAAFVPAEPELRLLRENWNNGKLSEAEF